MFRLLVAAASAFLALLAVASGASEHEDNYTAFVTASSFKADFGGLEAADAICQHEADGEEAVVPEGRYFAWLSDVSGNPSARFTQYQAPIVLPDGTRVADDFADLTDGELLHPIDMDAQGNQLGSLLVFTGTNSDGTRAGSANCANWTSTSVRGLRGNTKQSDARWSSFHVRKCGHSARLYCFQQ